MEYDRAEDIIWPSKFPITVFFCIETLFFLFVKNKVFPSYHDKFR